MFNLWYWVQVLSLPGFASTNIFANIKSAAGQIIDPA
jgi:hypothetical protein